MVRFFHTAPASPDTTETLLNDALTGYSINTGLLDYSGILYVAPTASMVRDARKIFHKLIMQRSPSLADRCYIPPEVATLDQISKKTYALSGQKRMISASLVPVVLSRLSGKGMGFSSLLAEFIGKIKRGYPGKTAEEMRSIFSDVFRDLNIPESTGALAYDCLDLFGRYRVFMDEMGLLDGDDVMTLCPGDFDDARGQDNHLSPDIGYPLLVINGFYDTDATERRLLASLIADAELTIVAVPCDSRFIEATESYINFLRERFPVDDLGLPGKSGRDLPDPSPYVCHSYPDPEGEVEGIARDIKSLFVSGRFRDLENIVVTFPDLKRYVPMIERVFKRYGIPFDLPGRRPLGKRRPFLDLVCLLRSAAEDFPRLPFAQFLSSRHFGNIPTLLKQWVPLLSLESGIISGRDSWLALVAEGTETVEIGSLGHVDFEKDLKWVMKRLQPLEEMRGRATFDEYVGALRKAADDFGFLETSPGCGKGPEDEAMIRNEKKAFQEVLEQLSFLGSLFPDGIGLVDFIEVLVHLLNAAFIEEEGHGVRVMDFFEVLGLSPEYLYFGGLTDEAMPRRQDIDYFLPDSVKRKMGFLHLDKYVGIQRFAFTTVVSSAGHCRLSFPLMDGETLHLPSSFLYPGEEIMGMIAGIFSMQEYLLLKGSGPLASHLSEVGIDPRALKLQQYLKVTDIDAYRYCPRKFFIERVLKVLPLRIKEYEVEALTLGNILHKMMEKIIPGPIGSLDDLRKRAIRVADEVIGEKRIPLYWQELIRDTFLEILPDIYDRELEIRSEGYRSSEVEKTIAGEPLKGIMLKGKIDRFDRMGDSVQIIDYKSGTAALTCSQVLKGNENLQLFLYAAIMKNQGYAVDRVGIYSLKDIEVKWCPPKTRGRGRGPKGKEKEGMDDYISASLKHLEEAVKGMRAGDFTARPLNEYNCRNCHEYALCPYIQQ